ncbi:hypothetical protein [Pseudomonas citronellolis]|uniref:hypothetical protein n=1 Tax=Pseudomonas citronellolis TaxID=53408 RepID=UPI0023E37728|nr:hypothetical protein [Pseudomonas citronellolis]MDF3931928.1 hypothetical protein [Pseudomonas citronellolis]
MRVFCGLIFLAFLSFDAYATSRGWNGEPRIISIENVPAVCLPDDAKEEFPVSRVLLSESYVSRPLDWELKLKPNAVPLILRPGDCIKFGYVPNGYLIDEASRLSELKINTTYVFIVDRVGDADHYNYFYSAAFCVGKSASGVYEYLQYNRLPNGGEVIPSCDSKRSKAGLSW